jgi:tetratricopeptide (TPR) repeat protein
MSKNGAILLLLVSAFSSPALAQAQRVETYGAQSPAVIAKHATVNYGLSPEQVQELTQTAAAGAVGPLADRIVDLSNRLGVTQGAAVTMLRIIGQQDVPFEKLPQKLAEVAEQYKQAMERLAALDPQDPITHDLVERAQAALKAGQLDEADQLASRAEQSEIAAARQAQQLAQKAQAAADQRLLRAAADRGVRGDIAMTRLRYLEAAQHFHEAAGLVPAGHSEEKGEFLLGEAKALLEQGDERADNAALVKAVDTYQLALQENTRERAPLQWARTQLNLAIALAVLGERETGTVRLEGAVAAFRAALEEYTRDLVPLDWALTQMNLGNVLRIMGEREGGTAHLEQAVAAFRAALEEYSPGRAPLNWAAAQASLGTALFRLGERESETARLEEAVAAYRSALEE